MYFNVLKPGPAYRVKLLVQGERVGLDAGVQKSPNPP